ncbi:MAG: GNAT family N-acetyltransferase [Caldilineaceae bacterium]
MKSQSIPMSIDEFHVMPHKLGWKYEYWEGQAYISPRMSSVVTTVVPVEPRPVPACCLCRPTEEDDISLLRPAYFAAFVEAVDYCDYPPEHVAQAAERNLITFFAGDRGTPLPASHLAFDPQSPQSTAIGAALIVEKNDGIPMIDLLYVVPEWQNRGVATALVSSAMNALHVVGYTTLKSRYLLSNEQSRNWHLRFGFVEEMNHFVLNNYYQDALYEWRRHKELGDLPAEELAHLETARNEWKARLVEAQEKERQEGFEIVLFDSE